MELCVIKSRNMFLVFCLLVAGCAGKAMSAINDAHGALERARRENAGEYARTEMSRAQAAFDLAEANLMEDTASGNRMAVRFAREAEKRALLAMRKAEEATAEENGPPVKLKPEKSDYSGDETVPPYAEEDISTSVIENRYIATARRRIRNAALEGMRRGKIPKGKVEIQAWVAPDGRVLQILLLKGDPSGELAGKVLRGVGDLKLDPFPPGMEADYLKVRVRIDTTGGRSK